ncbi:MAG: protein DpdG [Solirubrobacteraceae bacterium]
MAFMQPDILPAMAEAVHRQLRGAPGGRLTRETLQAWLLPKGIESQGGVKVFSDTLRELVAIGALEEEGGSVALPADVDGAREPGAMPEVIRIKAMLAELETDLWEKDDQGALVLVGARDLVRAVAWFLSLDIEDGPFEFERTTPALSDLQEQHMDRERPIFNIERWRPFVRWTRYLGFSSDLTLNIRGQHVSALMPDPTAAIRSRLQSLLDRADWTPIGDVMAALASDLPVLDGGIYRQSIHAKGAPVANVDCSPSLSLAFKRLEAAGTLELDPGGGDATTVTFANDHGAYHAMRWKGRSR